MFVEILLKFLISKVYIELLKTVHFKVLKPKNVQDTNESKLVLSSTNTQVDLLQDPLEEVGVESHGGGVSGVRSLRGGGALTYVRTYIRT